VIDFIIIIVSMYFCIHFELMFLINSTVKSIGVCYVCALVFFLYLVLNHTGIEEKRKQMCEYRTKGRLTCLHHSSQVHSLFFLERIR